MPDGFNALKRSPMKIKIKRNPAPMNNKVCIMNLYSCSFISLYETVAVMGSFSSIGSRFRETKPALLSMNYM